MGQLRIRWSWLARGAVVLAGGLAALQILPGLLAPPEAPPLAADVGLPRVVSERRVEVVPPERAVPAVEPKPAPTHKPRPKSKPSRGRWAATAVIGTAPRRHRPKQPAPVPPVDPAPAPPPVPIPAPEPEPIAPSPPPLPPPEDGSLEFAPH